MRPLRWILLGFLFVLLAPNAAYAEALLKSEYECNFRHPDPQDRSGESIVYRCRPGVGHNAPVFNVAVLKGTPAEVSRAHGYLLAPETELGPLSETIDLIQFGLSQHSFMVRPAMENVIACFSNNLFNSLTSQVQDQRRRLRRGLPPASRSSRQIQDAAAAARIHEHRTRQHYDGC